MRLYKIVDTKKIDTSFSETVSFIGSNFAFPKFTKEEINNAKDMDIAIMIYFDGEYLPGNVKEALYDVGKLEIEENTALGMLHSSLIGNVKYYLDILVDHKSSAILDIRIGVEILVNEDWKNNRDRDVINYKTYIDRNAANGYDTTNLTRMCAGYSAIPVTLSTIEDHDQFIALLKMIDDAKCFPYSISQYLSQIKRIK